MATITATDMVGEVSSPTRIDDVTAMRTVWIGIVLAIAAGLALLTISIGLAASLRNSHPDLALRFFPIDAQAQANYAATLLEQKPPAAGKALRLLRSSLSRDVAYPPAVRALGYVIELDGSVDKTRKLFTTAAPLLRRDLLTQLWLIQERVEADDVAGALHHYDLALSTSRFAPPILFPVLRTAARNPDLTIKLGKLLAASKGWKLDFLKDLIAHAPPDALTARLVDAVYRAGGRPPYEIPASLIWKLGQAGDYALAQPMYRRMHRNRQAGPWLRNGDFGQADLYPPLDWLESADPALGVRREPRDGAGNMALFFYPNEGASGVIISQVTGLQPGSYRMVGRAGGDLGLLYWSITCVGGAPNPVDRRPLASGGTFVFEIAIPHRGCAAQRISLNADPWTGNAVEGSWVDNLSITRIETTERPPHAHAP